jgi:hypothetical protein
MHYRYINRLNENLNCLYFNEFESIYSIIKIVSFTNFSSALEMPSSPVLKATPRIIIEMYVLH